MLNKIKKTLSVAIILILAVFAVSANSTYRSTIYVEKMINPKTTLGTMLKKFDVNAYTALSELNDNRLNCVIGKYKYTNGEEVYRVDSNQVWTEGNILYIWDMDMPKSYKLAIVYNSKAKAEERCRRTRINMEVILRNKGYDYLNSYIYRINYLIEELGDFNKESDSKDFCFSKKYTNSKTTIYFDNDSDEKDFFRTTILMSKRNLGKLGISDIPDKYSLDFEALKFNEDFNK